MPTPLKFSYTNSLLPQEALLKKVRSLDQRVEELAAVSRARRYDAWESSLCLPFDTELAAESLRITKIKSGKKLRYIVHVGIGGSSLGVKALYEALRENADGLRRHSAPEMFFADTTDPLSMDSLIRFLKEHATKPEQILIHVASKSGKTTETIANAAILLSPLKKKFPSIRDRITIATDADSPLALLAEKEGIAWQAIPKFVGGRFSTASGVGLIPLAAAGFDMQKFLKGARDMLRLCLATGAGNPAALSASVLDFHRARGRNIYDLFLFAPKLEHLGRWYRGLLAESIGKEKDMRGKIVRTGITPTVSLGSADLHSTGQLTFGGPRDKVTLFVKADPMPRGPSVPLKSPLSSLTLLGRSAGEILSAIYAGTTAAYKKSKLPFMEASFKRVDEESLGAFMQWKMTEVMLLAHLMGVNAFDQPAVERYKSETRRLLRG